MNNTSSPSTLSIVLAFLAVYIIWGSTYLAIMFAVVTIPPFLMAGVRFFVAGIIMFLWSYFRGDTKATFKNWKEATIVSGLLLLLGNGALVWAEQYLPSGFTALLVTTTPFWMILIDWLRPNGKKPDIPVVMGIVLGFIGVSLLINQDALSGIDHVYIPAIFAVLLAAFSWGAGSIYSKLAELPHSQIQSSALQLLTGGVLLSLTSVGVGELSQLNMDEITSKSLLALLYLITFGSIIGYTAYSFLLKHVAPAKVSTYAYVNPIVAVFLGWLLASEPVTPRTLLAAGIIICGVAFITVYKNRDAINISGFVGTVVRLPLKIVRKVGTLISK